MLGAVNIEQTKYLNFTDLEFLLGQCHRTLSLQRQQLHRLASTPEIIPTLLRWNYAQLPPTEQASDDFYLDPHTKHYTGAQNVLKGWCAAIRWADKLINSDYIHSSAGSPIYLENGDNYEDLRSRLVPLLQRLRSTLQWQPQRVITLVIDRGIYGNEVFSKIAEDPQHHLITWEKNYLNEPWDISQASGSTSLEKSYNHSSKTRHYEFHWKEQPWAKNSRLRQIEVRAVNPSGRVAYVSILTDDLTRPIDQIVQLMFSRWVQENDFKYLDKHYGINQITSYRSTPFEQLRESLTDRQVPSHQWQATRQQQAQLQKKKGRQLQAQDQAQRREQERQQRLTQIEQELQRSPQAEEAQVQAAQAAQIHQRSSLFKEQKQLKQSSRRHEQYAQKRAEQIEELHQALEQLQQQAESIERTVSRIDQVVAEGMVRLDTSSKTLMDVLKVIARNCFYRSLSGFKQAYDNYRDDHDYWRELTQSAGIVHSDEEGKIEVHLLPRSNHSPALASHIEQELTAHNARHPEINDGSGRELRLRLGDRRAVEVRLNPHPTGAPRWT